MIRTIFAAAAFLGLAGPVTAAPAAGATSTKAATKAVQCRDTKGHFIKCPAPVAKAVAKSSVAVAEKKSATATKSSSTTKRCRDAKGRFAKC